MSENGFPQNIFHNFDMETLFVVLSKVILKNFDLRNLFADGLRVI